MVPVFRPCHVCHVPILFVGTQIPSPKEGVPEDHPPHEERLHAEEARVVARAGEPVAATRTSGIPAGRTPQRLGDAGRVAAVSSLLESGAAQLLPGGCFT